MQGSHAQTLRRHYPPLPRATVIVSALRRHDRANPLRDGRGVQLARRGANEMTLMKIGLRQNFMPSAVLVMADPIELLPDTRQLTLWSSCSATIAFSWATPSANSTHGILLPTWGLGWQSIWVPSTMQQLKMCRCGRSTPGVETKGVKVTTLHIASWATFVLRDGTCHEVVFGLVHRTTEAVHIQPFWFHQGPCGQQEN